ncbi:MULTISPECIES: stage V sporulation protein AB [unclassified Bacillus (in: firmicutes)]|uniref:stage V sporulation protein AB n=1 Tax=unclassified Bacillus (in: firmicutes) TaxID=185979 RepID=UPI00080ADF24|nr:stage V sporulation protein AB [Bacillus sp. FJAT-27986]OCA83629.1 stage V sporulation protein AB [Bacillus sp. FJAT-27986]
MTEFVFVLIVGFSGGVSVGAGYVAFLTVLNIIPRLTQLTKVQSVHYFESAVILGAIGGTISSLWDFSLGLTPILLSIMGIFSGVFNGMLAAALTEVLNVFPILAKRIGMQERILYILMALVLGKIMGSLFQWIVYNQ